MNMPKAFLISVVLSNIMLGGCASKITEEEQYSGFLPSYEGLKQTTSANGQPVMRWVAEGFNPDAYDTVAFDQLELYPEPKPDERINLQTLRELQSLTSTSVSNALAQKYTIVPSADAAPANSRTLVLNAAITGVTASNEGMQWYEVLPVTAVAGAVSGAAGYRDQNTELYVEADLLDAATGQPVVKIVRKVLGDTLGSSRQAITANDFRSAIKGLGEDVNAFVNNRYEAN
ncbi:NhaP-type Na+(K+)/H+ antiporter [Stutzerimonas stutzeri]|uniref:NhaP-type Na+(K+)/H+ antiporter n=1 Tax=Stutzerimonas stutzeri TaxID=316 RepID=W8RTF9_STUST|nr:DUF3313 domain-containing protein [Stutzerimonas stutzeri]AHL75356.1 NhaP-type Na+(K+)/H+ antiporter [Stutzerimonas stutzeri]MCQ4328090.1 DUF3313 domain-containing protein [Stutzerimonas stutzeri]